MRDSQRDIVSQVECKQEGDDSKADTWRLITSKCCTQSRHNNHAHEHDACGAEEQDTSTKFVNTACSSNSPN